MWAGVADAGMLLNGESGGAEPVTSEAVEAGTTTELRLVDTDQLGLEANARRGAFTDERVARNRAKGQYKIVITAIMSGRQRNVVVTNFKYLRNSVLAGRANSEQIAEGSADKVWRNFTRPTIGAETKGHLNQEEVAMHLTYELKREVLNDVHDAAGTWQFEGGETLADHQVVGHYAAERRVVFKGTEAQNTAMLRMTLFFLDQEPPENITLAGAHDFNSGSEMGSVSAASRAYAAHIGKQFQRIGDTLTVG